MSILTNSQSFENITALEFDVSQAQQQLELLGYGESDPIFLRELPRKGEKGKGQNLTCTMATLPTTQNHNRAVYLVANGQGHSGADITHGRALMFESDDSSLTKEQHTLIWQKLGLEPTLQVTTRHSVHTYYVFDQPVPIEDWKKLQEDCNEYLNTDPKIKDAPRLMRLAGGWHTEINLETGEVLEPVQCQLINITEKKYGYQELREIIPPRPKKSKRKPGPNLPVVDIGGQRLSDYVNQAKKRLGTTLFEQFRVDDDGRCNCPWHDSKSGNSAWIREYPDSSGYHYNCPECTDFGDRQSINSFEFWLWQEYGFRTPIPTGKDYVRAAKEFCRIAGIEIPELQSTNDNTKSTQPEDDDGDKNLSDLLLANGELREILFSAIQILKRVDDPINDLKGWIQATFPTLSRSSVRLRGIQIAAAVCWQFGDKLTDLEICQFIQKICGISRIDVIQAEFKSARRIIDPPVPATQKALQAISAAYGEGAIRFNELSGKAEKNGEEFKDIELAYMGDELADYELPKTLATDAILVTAKKHSYHPVKAELESLRGQPMLTDDQWDNLAFHLLGTKDELAQIILKKSLIAAVARIYRPGCYVRMVPVLQGEQNAGKSTFLRLLAGDEFFCDSLGKLDNAKDDYQLLNSHWIHEWGEFDKLSKKSAGEIKAFITKTKDDYRSPYARSPESHKRQCVIFGSCNRRDFLKDSTGNTRYSVIEVGVINLELTKQWRDRIWATALARFEAGEQWELTQAEQALSEINNQAYAELDAWHEDIENYVSLRTEVSISAILDHLGIEKQKKDSLNSKRVRDVLTTLGWRKDKNPSTFQGQRTRVWRSPLAPRTTTAQPLHNPPTSCVEVVSEVVQTESLTNQDFQPFYTTCTTKNTKNFSGNKTTSPDVVSKADIEVREFSEKPNTENNCVGCVDTLQTNTGQGIQPCTTTAQLLHNHCTTVVSEPKKGILPRLYPRSNPAMHPEAEQKLIVSQLLSASNHAELAKVKADWNEDSVKWIYNYLLTPQQKLDIQSRANPLVDVEDANYA